MVIRSGEEQKESTGPADTSTAGDAGWPVQSAAVSLSLSLSLSLSFSCSLSFSSAASPPLNMFIISCRLSFTTGLCGSAQFWKHFLCVEKRVQPTESGRSLAGANSLPLAARRRQPRRNECLVEFSVINPVVMTEWLIVSFVVGLLSKVQADRITQSWNRGPSPNPYFWDALNICLHIRVSI